jgi:hypothetical protein
MPGRTKWLTNALTQTAVYWGSPTPDGQGGKTFDDPVELDCRWEDREELFIDASGQEKRSHAVVYLGSDVANGGFLYLGDLDDLSSDDEADPQAVDGAREVRAFQKVPSIDGRRNTRKAWL